MEFIFVVWGVRRKNLVGNLTPINTALPPFQLCHAYYAHVHPPFAPYHPPIGTLAVAVPVADKDDGAWHAPQAQGGGHVAQPVHAADWGAGGERGGGLVQPPI